MDPSGYPVDVRADYPNESSRGWAALTILLIKFLALIPHAIVLFFLEIAQVVVAFVAQFAVVVKGVYPQGMYEFVMGVLRWRTRVSAFIFSLTDVYPPFTLKEDSSYPVDALSVRPARSSRAYAVFTILVEILFVSLVIALVVWLLGHIDTLAATDSSGGSGGGFESPNFNFQSYSQGGLLLRQIAALPHFIILLFLGLLAWFIWFIVQWVILFTARFPRSLYDLVAGYVRWQTRVSAYALGLVERYPPFTMETSLAASSPAWPGGAPEAWPAGSWPEPPAWTAPPQQPADTGGA